MNPLSDEQTCDVCVIGGGLAGLVAAVQLAQSGKAVTLVEQARHVGGRAISLEKDGCLFNLGPHALYRKGPGMRILRQLGIEPNGGKPALQGVVISRSEAHALSLNPLSMITTPLLNWKEKRELISFYIGLPRVRHTALIHISFQAWLDTQVSGRNARALIEAMARLSSYAADFDSVPAGIIVRQMNLAIGGVLYLHGGWQSLVNALVHQANLHGVHIMKGRVIQLLGQQPQLRVCVDSGHQIRCRYVVSTMNLEALGRLATTQQPQASDVAIDASLVPVYGACLDLAVRRLPRADCKIGLGLDTPMYYSNHSHCAKLSEHASVVHVMKYLSANDRVPKHRDELEQFLDTVQPGWRAELVTMRHIPHILITQLPRVGKYEVLAEWIRHWAHRGVYLAGDFMTEDGILADAAITSAYRAAQLILRGAV